MSDDNRQRKHKAAMQKQKARVEAGIAAAATERGVLLLLIGDGQGKSSSAFGMVMRALGYGHRVGIVQFIEDKQRRGEENYLIQHCPTVDFRPMGTGGAPTMENREHDSAAARAAWTHAQAMLADPDYRLVVLDELTGLIEDDYLNTDDVLAALAQRPSEQSVVITGRGSVRALRDLADTVSEIKAVKHAAEAGIKARPGINF